MPALNTASNLTAGHAAILSGLPGFYRGFTEDGEKATAEWLAGCQAKHGHKRNAEALFASLLSFLPVAAHAVATARSLAVATGQRSPKRAPRVDATFIGEMERVLAFGPGDPTGLC